MVVRQSLGLTSIAPIRARARGLLVWLHPLSVSRDCRNPQRVIPLHKSNEQNPLELALDKVDAGSHA
jgi:hypothetical protein